MHRLLIMLTTKFQYVLLSQPAASWIKPGEILDINLHILTVFNMHEFSFRAPQHPRNPMMTITNPTSNTMMGRVKTPWPSKTPYESSLCIIMEDKATTATPKA